MRTQRDGHEVPEADEARPGRRVVAEPRWLRRAVDGGDMAVAPRGLGVVRLCLLGLPPGGFLLGDSPAGSRVCGRRGAGRGYRRHGEGVPGSKGGESMVRRPIGCAMAMASLRSQWAVVWKLRAGKKRDSNLGLPGFLRGPFLIANPTADVVQRSPRGPVTTRASPRGSRAGCETEAGRVGFRRRSAGVRVGICSPRHAG